jgi:hypothetical protein
MGSRRPPAAARVARWACALAAAAAALVAWALYPSDADGPERGAPLAGHPPARPEELAGAPPAPLPADFAPTDFDAARHAAALAAVRAALFDASAGADLCGDAEAWVADFGARTASLARDWPLEGLLRRLLSDDEDARVGCAAARALGLSGGRVAGAALERALARPERARAAVLALFDAGATGERACARAWWRADLRETLRARVAQEHAGSASGTLVVSYAQRALAEGPRAATPAAREAAGALAELLADAGAPGVRALLELGVDERFERARLLAVLERAPAAPSVLEELLARRRTPPEPYLLDVAARLHPAGALEWVATRARSGAHRAHAARTLAAFPGERALALLVELEGVGGLRSEDFLAAWEVAVARDDDSLRALAWRLLDAEQRTEARDYMKLLLLAERPEVLPAALILASSELLTSDLRRDGLLAVGERGARAHLEPLVWAFDQLGRDELELAAACALSAWRIGGADALRALLRVEGARLDALAARLARAPATGPARATLYLLAHELEPVFDSREPDLRGTKQ